MHYNADDELQEPLGKSWFSKFGDGGGDPPMTPLSQASTAMTSPKPCMLPEPYKPAQNKISRTWSDTSTVMPTMSGTPSTRCSRFSRALSGDSWIPLDTPEEDQDLEELEEDQPPVSIGMPPLRSDLGVWAQAVVQAEEWLEEEVNSKIGHSRSFIVDSSHFHTDTIGLAYRRSSNPWDRDCSIPGPAWGSTVTGVVEEENWVKIGELYLPTHLAGIPVLKPIGDDKTEILETKLQEVKALYRNKYGESVDSDEGLDDDDGVQWNVTVGRGAVHQKELYNNRLGYLEEQLHDVANLYKQKYGRELEDFEDDHEPLYDTQGLPWKVAIGRGIYQQRDEYISKVENLEDHLQEVKDAYRLKFGWQLDDYEDEGESLYDAEGTPWTVTVGRGIAEQRESYFSKLESLEQSLLEVKGLHSDEYDIKLAEYEDAKVPLYDGDGTAWMVSAGRGATQQSDTYNSRINALQGSLDDVKRQYYSKCGKTLEDYEDDQENIYDRDGTAWNVAVGRGANAQAGKYREKVKALNAKLDEVKSMYKTTYAKDLEGIAALYRKKYGCEFSCEAPLFDADGTPWELTRGRSVEYQREEYHAKRNSLEKTLKEVQTLYSKKCGTCLDDIEDAQIPVYDKDGTEWKVITGRGIDEQRKTYNARMQEMEITIAELKGSYKRKYGCDVDDDREGEYGCDQEGTFWNRTGPIDALTQRQKYLFSEAWRQKPALTESGRVLELNRGGSCYFSHGPTFSDSHEAKRKLRTWTSIIRAAQMAHTACEGERKISSGEVCAIDEDGILQGPGRPQPSSSLKQVARARLFHRKQMLRRPPSPRKTRRSSPCSGLRGRAGSNRPLPIDHNGIVHT